MIYDFLFIILRPDPFLEFFGGKIIKFYKSEINFILLNTTKMKTKLSPIIAGTMELGNLG
jgi:hypothetical protein